VSGPSTTKRAAEVQAMGGGAGGMGGANLAQMMAQMQAMGGPGGMGGVARAEEEEDDDDDVPDLVQVCWRWGGGGWVWWGDLRGLFGFL
jgi:hypothetical protein